MKKPFHKMTARWAAAGVAVVLAATTAGCAGSATSSSNAGSSGSSDKTLTVAYVPGWNDQVMSMNVAKIVLENKGYKVNTKELSEVATIFAGGAKGDIDLFNAAPERIQKAYWDQYKDKLEDLGTFSHAESYLAVPNYMSDVKSISDLPAHASELGGKIVGIEPGAGITKLAQKTITDYSLEPLKLQTSSTAAMLAELKKSTDAKQPIVVTIWAPFWANSTYGVRKLDDPKGSMGGPEETHNIARKGFSQDHPDVAKMMSNLKFTNQQFEELENSMVNDYGQGKEVEAIKAWLTKNPDFQKNLEQYIKS